MRILKCQSCGRHSNTADNECPYCAGAMRKEKHKKAKDEMTALRANNDALALALERALGAIDGLTAYVAIGLPNINAATKKCLEEADVALAEHRAIVEKGKKENTTQNFALYRGENYREG